MCLFLYDNIVGIPTLVIVDDKGDVITKNGRTAINLDPEGKVGLITSYTVQCPNSVIHTQSSL